MELASANRELKKQVSKLANENDGLEKHQKDLSDKLVIFAWYWFLGEYTNFIK